MLNFKLVSDKDDLKAKNIYLQKALATHGLEFEQHVTASLRFFYGDGNKQINIINGLLRIAFNSNMAGSDKLLAYFKEAIPHKCSRPKIGEAPTFGKKVDDAIYFTNDQLEAFITAVPRWHRMPKANKVKKVFNKRDYARTVAKQLLKNDVTSAEFANLLIDAIREAQASNKEASKAA